MNGEEAHTRTLSLHLTRTLDEIGLNMLTLKRRRQTYLFREQIYSVVFTDGSYSAYHFGSQTEGATTFGMESDIDMLRCMKDKIVIEDRKSWVRGMTNLLMLQENTAPGYCRLQLLRSDVPLGKEDIPNTDYVHDNCGRVILKNTNGLKLALFADLLFNWARNGPAESISNGEGFTDEDFISALHCSSWPKQAEGFIRRPRRHGWPSKSLVDEAIKHGVFLVPAGYKLSPTAELEWRLSSSLAERCLMFSLTIVHIKCYVVLKMLVKTFVEPRVQKCISSYHCKTTLLYTTENTESGLWRDDNLLQCVTLCLERLLTWVNNDFCPQFVIPEENLFAGKINDSNRHVLRSIFKDLIKKTDRYLLQIKIDDVGCRLEAKHNTAPSTVPITNSLKTMCVIERCEHGKQLVLDDYFYRLTTLVVKKDTPLKEVVSYVYSRYFYFKLLLNVSVSYERQIVEVFAAFYSCWLGSLLASILMSHGNTITRDARRLLYAGSKYDLSSKLKLASVLYCNEELHQAETTLLRLEEHFRKMRCKTACRCFDNSEDFIEFSFANTVYTTKGKKARALLFAHCVRFSTQELFCAPAALRYEPYRSVGNDAYCSYPFLLREQECAWMDVAVVDCLPLLYYLQYNTYRRLGKHGLRLRSLHNLDCCLRENDDIRHLETAWSLLGHCWELENNPQAAITCYMTSLEIKPRNNSAYWRVAVLCYNQIKEALIHTGD